MSKTSEINVTLSKTVQEQPYEPVRLEISVSKKVPLNEIDNEIRELYEQIDEQIEEIFEERFGE